MTTPTTPPAPTLRVVLEPDGQGHEIPPARRLDILEALLQRGHAVACPAANGTVAALDDSDLLLLREAGSNSSSNPGLVAGDKAGNGAGAAEGACKIHRHDITGMNSEAVVGLVDDIQEETGAYRPGAWTPWFPVIDFDRCTNCMQCLSFCLFDVYGTDAQKNIEVRNNDKCKTNCPACSRVCPEVAILFPKYGSGPINGAEVNKADLEHEKMKTDISALLGGDIYSMLRERHQRAASRFAKERDESRALKERMKCLKKLGSALDIPEEVLMALPSLDEIQRTAAQKYSELGNQDTRQNGQS